MSVKRAIRIYENVVMTRSFVWCDPAKVVANLIRENLCVMNYARKLETINKTILVYYQTMKLTYMIIHANVDISLQVLYITIIIIN